MTQKPATKKDSADVRALAKSCGPGFYGEAIRMESVNLIARCGPLSVHQGDGGECYAMFDSETAYRITGSVAVRAKTPQLAIKKALAEARKVATGILSKIEEVESHMSGKVGGE